MSVYFVVQEKVTDEDGMAAYNQAAGPTKECIGSARIGDAEPADED